MSTSFTFRRTVAGAITITATFFAATACGSATDVSQSITRTSKETPTNKAYPADGRENRNSARNASTHRQYPADGRENRNAVNGSTGRQYPADGRENRNSGAPLPLPRGRDTCC
ncbi:hypothetical protein IEZ26_13545 [Nocardioides cavernae]|uniref:Lipoprotein n=1 Tax=Nocardioides cavernae TaxID=1921566 RepID=A0ABR8NBY4_9ACTN|nr:hypothetical protein [Nocardioides cavernae]MBD3925652.1 hypothetical protein [Nocardioides cavernae]